MTSTATRMLDIAAQQFAEKGFSGASMRSIASAVGTTQATIYHHFPNKHALYLAVLARHFRARTSDLPAEMERIDNPEQQLQFLIQRILQLMAEDEQFRQLYLRELLEGNEARLKDLADNVFGELTQATTRLLQQLAPHLDSHLMLFSLAGLVCHHLEARKLSPFVPGGRKAHQRLDVLAEHITQVMLHGVKAP